MEPRSTRRATRDEAASKTPPIPATAVETANAADKQVTAPVENLDIADLPTQTILMPRESRKRPYDVADLEDNVPTKTSCRSGYVSLFRESEHLVEPSMEEQIITEKEKVRSRSKSHQERKSKEYSDKVRNTRSKHNSELVSKDVPETIPVIIEPEIELRESQVNEQDREKHVSAAVNMPTTDSVSKGSQNRTQSKVGDESLETPLGSLDRTRVEVDESVMTTDTQRFLRTEWGTQGTLLKVVKELSNRMNRIKCAILDLILGMEPRSTRRATRDETLNEAASKTPPIPATAVETANAADKQVTAPVETLDIADLPTQLILMPRESRKRPYDVADLEDNVPTKTSCRSGYVSLFRESKHLVEPSMEEQQITEKEKVRSRSKSHQERKSKEYADKVRNTRSKHNSELVSKDVPETIPVIIEPEIELRESQVNEQDREKHVSAAVNMPTTDSVSKGSQNRTQSKVGDESLETPLGSLDRTRVEVDESVMTTDTQRFLRTEWGTQGTLLKVVKELSNRMNRIKCAILDLILGMEPRSTRRATRDETLNEAASKTPHIPATAVETATADKQVTAPVETLDIADLPTQVILMPRESRKRPYDVADLEDNVPTKTSCRSGYVSLFRESKHLVEPSMEEQQITEKEKVRSRSKSHQERKSKEYADKVRNTRSKHNSELVSKDVPETIPVIIEPEIERVARRATREETLDEAASKTPPIPATAVETANAADKQVTAPVETLDIADLPTQVILMPRESRKRPYDVADLEDNVPTKTSCRSGYVSLFRESKHLVEPSMEEQIITEKEKVRSRSKSHQERKSKEYADKVRNTRSKHNSELVSKDVPETIPVIIEPEIELRESQVNEQDREKHVSQLLEAAGLADAVNMPTTDSVSKGSQNRTQSKVGDESLETPLGSLDRTRVEVDESVMTTDTQRFLRTEWGTQGTLLKVVKELSKGHHPLTVKVLVSNGPVPQPCLEKLTAARCFKSLLELQQRGFVKLQKDATTLEVTDILCGSKIKM